MEVPASTVKTPEAEPDTPTRIQPANGVLKRHAPVQHLHPPAVIVAYRECQRNHAAGIGGHAVDGCGEFLASLGSNPTDPSTLKCAACGCHRNFHRREPDGSVVEYRSVGRHIPHPPIGGGGDSGSSPSDSPSPPPISSAYAPHMLLALSQGGGGSGPPIGAARVGRKRFRTKFTQDQKERMLELAEKVGWKMQKPDDGLIGQSCNQIGVERGVFKVWMHNNKNTFGKKDQSSPAPQPNGGSLPENSDGKDNNDDSANTNLLGTNGSSSSS